MSAATPSVLLEHAGFRYRDVAEQVGTTREEARDADSAPTSQESRVEDVCLAVEPGTCTVLCGRSGNGKSTVLRMVNGLAGTFFPGDVAGIVAVCGTEVHALTPRERTERTGVVLQDPRSQFFMNTVADEIAFSAENLGIEPKLVAERVARAAERCGVATLLRESLSRLSSGQKQRVALAAAICCTPRVLLLDEPTSNLDEEGSQALIGILAELMREGCALVVSEHRLTRFLPIADEFVYLEAGRVTARWSAQELSKLPAQEASRRGLRHPTLEQTDTAPHANASDPCSARANDGAAPRPRACAERNATLRMTQPADGAAATSPALGIWRVENLAYRYPSSKRGVHDLDASFPCGAVTVVQGPNGAGKTTLAKLLVGALKPQAGRITLDGTPASARERRRNSYFVMQDADYQLYAASVADEVVLGRRVDDTLQARARRALEAFDLAELAHRHPQSLSGGQKQRVTLAAAYCSDAPLIVLDEPTSGLDGQGVVDVAHWCRALAAEGKAVVVITHDHALACRAADQIVALERD